MNVKEFIASVRAGKFAWPGGYPKFWITYDCEALSYEAVRSNALQIARAIKHNTRCSWQVIACDINWEDPDLYCSHTNARIESAYAEESAES